MRKLVPKGFGFQLFQMWWRGITISLPLNMPWIKWITELYVWMSDIAFCIIYCSNIPWVSQYYSRASKQTELPEGLWFGRSSPFVCRGHDLFTLARNIYSAGCSNADYQLRPLRTGNNVNWWIDISKWISMFSIISDREGERDIKGSIKENRFLKDSRTWGDEMGKRLGLAAGDQSWKSGDWSRGNNKQEQLLWSPLTVNIRSPGSHTGRGDGPCQSSGRS